MSRLRSRLSFANVVSVLALFVALGGTATAAVLITGKNVKNSSLTGVDVKNSSLTGTDIKNNSVRSVDITNGSLLATDFKPGQLPAGTAGQQGPKGPQGQQGVQGAAGTAVAYASVDQAGTLDSANSKNIASVVKLAGNGQYCIVTSVPVHVAVGGISSANTDIVVRALANAGTVHPTCNGAKTYIETRTTADTLADAGFFIIWD